MLWQLRTEQDPIKKEEMKTKIVKETIPFYLSKFEKIVSENNGFSVGDSVSIIIKETRNSFFVVSHLKRLITHSSYNFGGVSIWAEEKFHRIIFQVPEKFKGTLGGVNLCIVCQTSPGGDLSVRSISV